MRKTSIIGFSALFIAVGAVAVLAFFWRVPEPTATKTPTSLIPGTSLPPPFVREVLVGSKEYRNMRYRFSLLYQEDMKMQEFEEPGGAQTITFEDTSNLGDAKGFQLFATTHPGGEVDEAFVGQFIPGAHSFEPIVVSGAAGVAFVSQGGSLGEVREVWFAKETGLYQVAAPKAQEKLLLDVLQTWVFIPL